jgi:hypothetical protein
LKREWFEEGAERRGDDCLRTTNDGIDSFEAQTMQSVLIQSGRRQGELNPPLQRAGTLAKSGLQIKGRERENHERNWTAYVSQVNDGGFGFESRNPYGECTQGNRHPDRKHQH